MRIPLLSAALCLTAVSAVPSVRAQARVDLTPWQTDLRNQGSRTTCIVFAAVAALEARYKRMNVDRDLSEEFVSYMAKLFWLHPDWNELALGGADMRENQMGWTGGGNGGGMLEWLCNGLAAPLEADLQYRPTLAGPLAWNDPFWGSQWNANGWNLHPANLPRDALRAPAYYYGTGFQWINQPRSATALEAVLQNGREIVWDFNVRGTRPLTGIWHASSAPPGGAHSMLIVGYDRTHPNPNEHYFIVKNSWGPTGNPGGYTHIGYDYLQYGVSAGYVTGAVSTGRQWPELKLLGRRNISFDGWRGTLDIHHLPGIAQMWLNQNANGVTDRRLGTFYDQNGVAHRVNGMVYGNSVHFWFKGAPAANMRWDEQRETPTVGRSFVYTIVENEGVEDLAGRHHDNPGSTPSPPFGGYARSPQTTMTSFDGFLPQVFNTNQPWAPEQYLGAWKLQTGGYWFYVRFGYRDDQVVPAAQQATHYGLVGHVMLSPTTVLPITALVDRTASRNLKLEFTHPAVGLVKLDGWMLTWQRGVVAGLAEVGPSAYEAFYLYRLSDYTPGAIVTYGPACGPANAQPYHRVTGLPEVSQNLSYEVINMPANGVSFLSLGIQNHTWGGNQLPFALGSYGMPGCYLFTSPVWTMFVAGNGQGVAAFPQTFAPGLRGLMTHSQYFVLAPGANAANLISSNAVAVALGGTH